MAAPAGATPSTDTLKATEALRQLEALQAEARRMEDEIKEKEAAKEAALAKAASFQEKLADQEVTGCAPFTCSLHPSLPHRQPLWLCLLRPLGGGWKWRPSASGRRWPC